MKRRSVHIAWRLGFEQASGLLIISAMMLALALANSSSYDFYWFIHHTPVSVNVGTFEIRKPLVTWINEGLMVFFFLYVALETKREILEGQLSTKAQAALPGIAAVAGMAVPAGLYIAINWSHSEATRGWAIPTATDIVLVIAVLMLLGKRIPVALRVFITALAVFDDVGAITIIAVFFGEEVHVTSIALAGLGLAALVTLNRLRVASLIPYGLAGMFLWVVLVKSGIHATLAGVAVGLAVPLRSEGAGTQSLLKDMEHSLRPWVALGVLPLFAFFNAGISFAGASVSTLFSSPAIGVMVGLFVGKQIGVFTASWLAVRFRLARLPNGVTWGQVYGVSVLAGMGFTVSLFITPLALADATLVASAKLGILLGSTASALVGVSVLTLATKPGR